MYAQYNPIIPFSDGQALYDASPAREKTLLKIPGANHNDIMTQGFQAYMEAIQSFTLYNPRFGPARRPVSSSRGRHRIIFL